MLNTNQRLNTSKATSTCSEVSSISAFDIETDNVTQQHEAHKAVAVNVLENSDCEMTTANEKQSLLYRRNASLRDTVQLSAAQGVIILCMGIFGYTQITFLAPWAQRDFVNSVSVWWKPSVPESPDDDDKDSSFLLTSPGPYVLLFGIIPLAISAILYELVVRDRIESYWGPSSALWRTSAFFGRKASLLQWLGELTIGEAVFIAVFLVAGNAAVVWYAIQSQLGRVQGRFGVGSLDTALGITGIAFGYSCMFNFASLLLPTARNFTWLAAVNVSYANGIKYHRWLGWAVLLTLVLHIVPFYWLWYRQGTLLELSLPCFSCSLEYMAPGYAAWMMVFGEISTLLLIVLGVTSIPSIRRHRYQTFAKGHRLAGLSMLFAVLHWAPMLWWLLPAMIPLYIQKIRAFNNVQGPPLQMEECTVLKNGIIKIVACHKPSEEIRLGQFVYLIAPSLDPEQMHPITIASSPKLHGTRFTLLIKELGDWTEDLAKYIDKCSAVSPYEHPDIRLDGFYGASLAIYKQYPVVCLLGGGIGATPLFSILENMLADRQDPQSPVHNQRVFVTFVFRELSLLEHIHPVLMALKQTDRHGDLFSFSLSLTCSLTEEELNQPISTQASYAQPKNVLPFHSSQQHQAHSIFANVLSYVLTFALAALFMVWVENDGGLLARWTNKSKYWPIQRAIEVFSLGIVSRVGVAGATIISRAVFRASEPIYVPSPGCIPTVALQEPELDPTTDKLAPLTLREMLKMHKVCFGRPNVSDVMAKAKAAVDSCGTDSPDHIAGVFISGPTAMKKDAHRAIASLGTDVFEVHEEEFEL